MSNIVAVFPLHLVQTSLRVRGIDEALRNKFGYIHAKRMTASVRYVPKDLSFVHCGQYPLIAWVGIQTCLRFGNYTKTCYINDRGQHLYPA